MVIIPGSSREHTIDQWLPFFKEAVTIRVPLVLPMGEKARFAHRIVFLDGTVRAEAAGGDLLNDACFPPLRQKNWVAPEADPVAATSTLGSINTPTWEPVSKSPHD